MKANTDTWMCMFWELVFILLLQEAIKTFFKINLSIKFTSQLSRLLKSMCFCHVWRWLIHFLKTLLRIFLESGGAMRDRTADLLRARQALSQLSYNPNVLLQKKFSEEKWWAIPGSNQWPPPCKGGALPTELIALNYFTSSRRRWWVVQDSNLRPID